MHEHGDHPWRYPYQPRIYKEQIGMPQYEKEMADSPLNYVGYDDYIELTEPAVGSGNQGGGPDWPKLGTTADASEMWMLARERGAANREHLLREQAKTKEVAEVQRQKEIAEGKIRPPKDIAHGPFLSDLEREKTSGKRGTANGRWAKKDIARAPIPPSSLGGEGTGVRGQDAAGADPSPPTPLPQGEKGEDIARARRRATKRQTIERRTEVIRQLTTGRTNAEIILMAMDVWGVKRRMALLYIQKAKAKLADDASKTDQLGEMELSKQQHNYLYSLSTTWLERCQNVREFSGLVGKCTTMLKGRDQLSASIHEHRTATRRDRSPDSVPNTEKRDRKIVMDFDEWFERMEHWRNMWWYELLQAGYVRWGLKKTHAQKDAKDAEAGFAKTEQEMANVNQKPDFAFPYPKEWPVHGTPPPPGWKPGPPL